MRNTYEKISDIENEDAVMEYLGTEQYPFPKFARIDRAVVRDGAVTFVEVKCRTNPSNQYDTYMISETKWDALRAVASLCKAASYLVVRFTDKIMSCRVDVLFDFDVDIRKGGRTDRHDEKDVETCVFIPMRFWREVTPKETT